MRSTCVALALACLGPVATLAAPSLTVADAIETTRVNAIEYSPDQKRYVISLVKGDVQRNGNWLEVFAGSTGSLDEASRGSTIGRLFTPALSDLYDSAAISLTYPGKNPITWLNSRTIAFLWQNEGEPTSVVSLDTESKEQRTLALHPTNIVYFRASADGTIYYAARMPSDRHLSAERLNQGFAVSGDDLLNVLNGDIASTMTDQMYNNERYLIRAGATQKTKLLFSGRSVERWLPAVARFSPDGRYAIVDAAPTSIPEEWREYTEPALRMKLGDWTGDERSGFKSRAIQQLYVLDVSTGATKPLWNAPNAQLLDAVWAPNGKSILIGPSFAPLPEANDVARAGRAVVEFMLDSGEARRVPVPDRFVYARKTTISWVGGDLVRLQADGGTFHFRRSGKSWVSSSVSAMPLDRRVDMRLRQGLNDPPILVAVDRVSGKEKTVRDLNPQLRGGIRLGKVEWINWSSDGLKWSGLLYFPVDYEPARKYPLVIQTHGHASPQTFSLYGYDGPGLGPGGSVFAAQPVASRNIFVLHIQDQRVEGINLTPKEPEMYMHAYEAAVGYLDREGYIDTEKVGLSGFSRTGWHVQYALAHSDFRYAAAITSDNADFGYIQSSIAGWPEEHAMNNGAPAFGDGLLEWLERTPGFNADHIVTPLRLQRESKGLAGILLQWEMYSRLLKLNRPVELFVVPNIDRGNHALQNPVQLLASQQGAVDWFDFWLNSRVDSDPRKQEQYARWSKLRERWNSLSKVSHDAD